MKFLSIIFFCAMSGSCFAQKTANKLSLNLKAGASIPVSGFADKTYSNPPGNSAGLAQTGLSSTIDINYGINKSFDAIVLLGASFNKQDEISYENYYKQSLGSNSRVEASTNSWKILKIMAGGNFIAPHSGASKFYFQLQLTAGVCKTAVPAHEYTAYNENGMFMASGAQSKTSLPWSFCYQAEIDLRYLLNNHLQLLLSFGYFNSSPKLTYTYNPNFPLPGPLTSAKKEYSLASVNPGIGIGIKL